jgi:hypothetical protein
LRRGRDRRGEAGRTDPFPSRLSNSQIEIRRLACPLGLIGAPRRFRARFGSLVSLAIIALAPLGPARGKTRERQIPTT